jgi:hypothetical protein
VPAASTTTIERTPGMASLSTLSRADSTVEVWCGGIER